MIEDIREDWQEICNQRNKYIEREKSKFKSLKINNSYIYKDKTIVIRGHDFDFTRGIAFCTVTSFGDFGIKYLTEDDLKYIKEII